MHSSLAYHNNTQDPFNKPPQSSQQPPPRDEQQHPANIDSTSIDPLSTTTPTNTNEDNNNNNNNHFSSTPRTTTSTSIPTDTLRYSNENNQDALNLPTTIPRYSRRVSFNNLNPEDDGDFLYNRPIYNQASGKQYTSSYSGPSSSHATTTATAAIPTGGSGATSPLFPPTTAHTRNSISNNENYRYGSSPPAARHASFPFASLPKVPNFDVISQAPGSSYYQQQQQQRKRRLKLPNPPEKSILKNKVSQQQLEYNYRFGGNIEDATINYHQEEEEEAQAKEDAETEKQATSDANEGTAATEDMDQEQQQQPQRRKSYAGMTDEELLALDPQFNMKPKTSNFGAFKFDNQKIYYTNRRSSTSGVSALEKLAQQQQQQQYPSSNENNYPSIALTVQHDDYDQIELRRTLLTTISGRKHSWNSLDWLFSIGKSVEGQNQSILNDGDYLIVASFIPQKFIKDYNSKRRKMNCDEFLKSKCFNLLEYLKLNLAELNLKIKMTVEFVVESAAVNTIDHHGNEFGSKYMLNKLVKQYHPNIFIVGIKSSNLNFKYKIKKSNEKNYLVKYSSFIVKHAGIPVVLVSSHAKHTSHELKQQQQSQSQSQQQQQQQQQQQAPDSGKSPVPRITFSDDLVAVGTNSSSSIESVESFVPQTTPTNEGDEKNIIENPLPFNSFDKYQDWITAISDRSFDDSINYLQAIKSKDDSLKIDGKIHEIYKTQSYGPQYLNSSSANGSSTTSRHGSVASDGSGSGGGGGGAYDNVYRVKSMISIEDDEDAKRRKELRRKRRASSGTTTSATSGRLSSTKSNDSGGSSGNESKGKKSFWRKIGFKKG